MNQVPAALAVIAGLALFLLPGMLFLGGLRADVRRTLEADEALFFVLGTSIAATSWLGLVLAELGRFSLPLAGLICAVVVAASLTAATPRRKKRIQPIQSPWRRTACSLS